MRERGAKIVFVTSPNNPDGSLTPGGELDTLLALPALIVLDEAYIEARVCVCCVCVCCACVLCVPCAVRAVCAVC